MSANPAFNPPPAPLLPEPSDCQPAPPGLPACPFVPGVPPEGLAIVPSAFTIPTGKAHWEVLLRARAIENGMWIIAAAQVGSHEDGRETWGHSMVISPWGEVILELSGEKSEIKTVEIDLTEVASTRRQIPSLQSDSFYELSKIPLV